MTNDEFEQKLAELNITKKRFCELVGMTTTNATHWKRKNQTPQWVTWAILGLKELNMTIEKINEYYSFMAINDDVHEGYSIWVLEGGTQHLPEAIDELHNDIEQVANNIAYATGCDETCALQWVRDNKQQLGQALKEMMGQIQSKPFAATISAVSKAWGTHPDEWSMLGAVEYSSVELVKFEENEAGSWTMERWDETERVWYVALEGLTQDDIVPIVARVANDRGQMPSIPTP